MKWLLPLALLSACSGESSCEDAAEEYASHLRTRYEACKLDFSQVETLQPEPCDDDAQETILCLDNCASHLTCGALTGSNTTELGRYLSCALACPDVF